jgi:cytidylate kinase
MIITIDGPAGAGKSTVAKRLAERLGFEILDTGAMYRAVTWAVLQAGLDPGEAAAVERLARSLRIEIDGPRVRVDAREVSREIRDPRVTENVSAIADHPGVRRILVTLQRRIAGQNNYVCEGRDQGTVAFPQAEVKIFLTASAEHRARRRWQELLDHHVQRTYEEVLAQQIERDRRDIERAHGGLRPAADAIEVVTDDKSIEQVVDELEQIVRRKMCVEYE